MRFQYPHTDRCPCNKEGVETLARCMEPFSILTRIDAPVTLQLGRDILNNNVFQYPHTDRCPCNLLRTGMSTHLYFAFQYPHTDRCPCNVGEPVMLICCVSLSVSSHGSMP